MQHRLALALLTTALLLPPTFAQSGTNPTAPTPYPRMDRTHKLLPPAGSVETLGLTPYPHLDRERLANLQAAPFPQPRLNRTEI